MHNGSRLQHKTLTDGAEKVKTLMLSNSEKDIAAAGHILKNGGLAAIPTETVYGLAANALDAAAVSKIFLAKGRPQDNPLIVHIARLEQIDGLVAHVPEMALTLAAEFWPGPLTMILPKSPAVPDEVTCGLDSVGIRMPSHETARAIIESAGVPLAAPSANLSGKPSPTTAQHVALDMDGRIDAIVDGGACTVGVESTVVSLCGERPLLLRPGAITPDMIASAVGCCDVSHAVLEELGENEKAESPGMKYKHYAPETEVLIVRGTFEQFAEYVHANAADDDWALCFVGEGDKLAMAHVEYGVQDDLLSQARGLFGALRWLDEMKAKRAFARCCEPVGVGLAVYNRLLRAAGFRVIETGQPQKQDI